MFQIKEKTSARVRDKMFNIKVSVTGTSSVKLQ